MEQFESQANFNAHYHSTGPEARTHILSSYINVIICICVYMYIYRYIDHHPPSLSLTPCPFPPSLPHCTQILEQLQSRGLCLDAFVMAAGTGGTIAGVSRCVKQSRDKTKIVLVDPPGSSLYHKVRLYHIEMGRGGGGKEAVTVASRWTGGKCLDGSRVGWWCYQLSHNPSLLSPSPVSLGFLCYQ